jgi:DNA-binding cell septation regulator SpoVG
MTETNNYVLLVRVTKLGEEEVSFKKDYSNSNSSDFLKLAKVTSDEVNKAYASTTVKNNFLGVDVNKIVRSFEDGEEGVLVNLTLRVMSDENLNEDLLREELMKSLETDSSESIPTPSMITAEVEDVMDFDECSNPELNTCASSAQCINEPGSYSCKCKGIFTDLDPLNPGRVCASEVKSCDICNARGDCVRDETGDMTSCRCHRMYLGRYCEINGLRECCSLQK